MKNFLLLALTILLCHSCAEKKSTDQLLTENALQFNLSAFNSGSIIGLRADSTYYLKNYSSGCTGGYAKRIITGKYALTGNEIEFFPKMVWQEVKELKGKLKRETFPYEAEPNKAKRTFFLVDLEQGLSIITFYEGEFYNEKTKKMEKVAISHFKVNPNAPIAQTDFFNSLQLNQSDYQIAALPKDLQGFMTEDFLDL